MPLISIYGTVYNNDYVIEDSILSLRRALPNFEEDYELVIVDNYSTDGTWEKLLKLRRIIKNLRLLRYRCSRGKGRDIALRHTIGDYVMYVDFDCLFGSELRVIVDRLCKLCVKGELWNFGFSMRETMVEQLGGWRDLNFGEDWELYRRAIMRGIKLRIIAVKSPIRNVRVAKGGFYGERRYARDKVGYVLRRLRNLRDVAIGWGLNPVHVIYSGDSLIRFSTFALLIFSAIYSFANAVRSVTNDMNAKYQVYAGTKYLLPEEVGLPRKWFYLLWEDLNLTWPAVSKHVRELIGKDPEIHIALLPLRKILISFRDYGVFKESMKEYAFSTSHKKIERIVFKH